MSRTGMALVGIAVALLTTGLGYSIESAAGSGHGALGPAPVTVILDIEHSAFVPKTLDVVQGTKVRFVVVNADPINHEFIVGPPEVHDRHRNGREEAHPPVAGEVSVPAGSRGVTSYVFNEPGDVAFVCHLPGHADYGMKGTVTVVPRS